MCDFLLTTASGRALGLAIGGRRQVLESGENAEELTNVGIVFARCFRIPDGAPQHLGDARGSIGR